MPIFSIISKYIYFYDFNIIYLYIYIFIFVTTITIRDCIIIKHINLSNRQDLSTLKVMWALQFEQSFQPLG